MIYNAIAVVGIEIDISDIDTIDEESLGDCLLHCSGNGRYVLSVFDAEGTIENEVGFSPIPLSLQKDKRKLKSFLEPLRLWDESKFGLYAMRQEM